MGAFLPEASLVVCAGSVNSLRAQGSAAGKPRGERNSSQEMETFDSCQGRFPLSTAKTSFLLLSTCKLHIITVESKKNRAPIHSSRSATHSSCKRAPINGLGKSGLDRGCRNLFLLRPPASQKGKRSVCTTGATSGDPGIITGPKEASCRDGKSAAGSGNIS